MTLEEYLIDHLAPSLFEEPYFYFWVDAVIGAFPLIGPETDPNLDRLIQELLHSYATGQWSSKEGETVPDEIMRLRGSAFYRDDSPMGRKYRCLFAIGSTVEVNNNDTYNWQYGVVTAFQLINFNNDKDEILIERIKDGLSKGLDR